MFFLCRQAVSLTEREIYMSLSLYLSLSWFILLNKSNPLFLSFPCYLIFSISLLRAVRFTFMAPMGQNSWQQKQRMHFL